MESVHSMRKFLLLMFLLVGLVVLNSKGMADSVAMRYEKELEAFKQSDLTNPPPTSAVLFLGSSTIRLWKSLKKDFPEIPLINRGFGGSTIAESIALIDTLVFRYKPRQIVFYAGDNDIAQGKLAGQVTKDFVDFEKAVHAQLPKTTILFIAIKPSPSRWKFEKEVREANRSIQAYCEKGSNLRFLNIFPLILNADGLPRPDLFVADQLHLNSTGYQISAKALRESHFLDSARGN